MYLKYLALLIVLVLLLQTDIVKGTRNVFELDIDPQRIVVEPKFQLTATITYVDGKAKMFVGTRRVYQYFGFQCGPLPCTVDSESTFYLLPDEVEFHEWIQHQRVQIGNTGHFYGTTANNYRESPLADPRWVERADLERRKDNSAFFYHNLWQSFDAHLWQINATVHSTLEGGRVHYYTIAADGRVLEPLSTGKFFTLDDHVVFVESMPKRVVQKRVVNCYEKQEQLACIDSVNGFYIDFHPNARAERPSVFKRCFPDVCYELPDHFHSDDVDIFDSRQKKNSSRLKSQTTKVWQLLSQPGNASTTDNSTTYGLHEITHLMKVDLVPLFPDGFLAPPVAPPGMPPFSPKENITVSFPPRDGHPAYKVAIQVWPKGSAIPRAGHQVQVNMSKFHNNLFETPPLSMENPGNEVEFIEDMNAVQPSNYGSDHTFTTPPNRADEWKGFYNHSAREKSVFTGSVVMVCASCGCKVYVPSSPTTRDFEILESEVSGLEDAIAYNNAQLSNKIFYLEKMLFQVVQSLAHVDDQLLSHMVPSLPKFRTKFLSETVFQTYPLPDRESKSSSCHGTKIFFGNRWVDNTDPQHCRTWGSAQKVKPFSDGSLHIPPVRGTLYQAASAEEEDAWTFLMEHRRALTQSQDVATAGGLATSLRDVVSMDAGTLSYLLAYFHICSLLSICMAVLVCYRLRTLIWPRRYDHVPVGDTSQTKHEFSYGSNVFIVDSQ